MNTTPDFPAALTRDDIRQIEAAAADVNSSRNQARRMALELLTKSRTELAERFKDQENIEAAIEMAEMFKSVRDAMAREQNWIEAAQARLCVAIDGAIESFDDEQEGGHE
jgi:hypothetical protein